ncbi:multidrug/Oligosaccharidyl-lipid/Polysaccharide flippase [Lyophyllum atratum]|nr:multidrug/Oligosaccharidyl-lipid/Polysaccharide flippase [Lyophyllum atratum]
MFWQEMRAIAAYALPAFGSQLLEFSLVVVPVISVGHLSTKALAAISLASLTGSVTGASVLQGLASALDTLLPSAYTSSQPHLVGLWAQRTSVIMFIALLPIYLIWFNAEQILLSLKQDSEVAHLASLYLRWFSLGLPAIAFNAVSRRYFQSQGLFFLQTRINFFVAPINLLLNYILVWGPEPVRLGFIGAPMATAISFNLISLASVLYGVYFAPRKAWHPISTQMFTNLGLVTRLGIAGIGETASRWWAWEFIGLAASFLGPIALASQSILITSSATTFQAAFSLSSATSTRIGHLLGEKNPKRAGVAVNASLALALIVSLITSITYLSFRHSWGKMFNDDPEVITLVASVIPVIAFFQVVDANATVTAAVLRTRGMQSITALLNTSAFYVIGLPLGVWLAFRWDLGLHGLWTGLAAALVYCSVIGTVLCFKTDWNREVVKVMERIAEEEHLRRVEDDRSVI